MSSSKTITAKHVTVSGAPEGFDAKLLAREAARGQPVIHIARDDRRMEAMRAALAVLSPASVVLEFPAWDCLPYDRVSPNPDIGARRMSTLAALVAKCPCQNSVSFSCKGRGVLSMRFAHQ